MKRKKQQSPLLFLSKIASNLVLASTFVASSLVGFRAAVASTAEPEVDASEATAIANDVPQIAQAADGTLLNFSTQDYAVRVFREGGRTLMNVFDRSRNLLRVDRGATTFAVRNNVGSYITTGDFSGVQATYYAQVFPNRFARLEIVDGSENALVSQDATTVAEFNVPDDVVQQVRQDNILFFETSSYAVRVIRRDNQRFMNVYNKFTTQQELNGKAASLAEPEFPYEQAVSYVASGERNGQPVRYFARIDGSGRTVFEIFNATGQRLFQEPGIGPVVVNIPESDLPGDLEIGQVNDAYVAAVFGDESTLNEVKQLYPEAYIDNSARQGRFINAGSFPNQDAATLRVLELRSRGFNARLVYRDVRYR